MQCDGDVILSAASLGGLLSLVEEQPVGPARRHRQPHLLLGVTADVRKQLVRQLDVTELGELHRVAYSHVCKITRFFYNSWISQKNKILFPPNTSTQLVRSIKFSLNVFTEFSDFSDKKYLSLQYRKRARTCHLLCKRPGYYHSTSKTHVRDRIFELSPTHASVIYPILWICWIHWISVQFRENSSVRFLFVVTSCSMPWYSTVSVLDKIYRKFLL